MLRTNERSPVRGFCEGREAGSPRAFALRHFALRHFAITRAISSTLLE